MMVRMNCLFQMFIIENILHLKKMNESNFGETIMKKICLIFVIAKLWRFYD